MRAPRKVRDNKLIDALEASKPEELSGPVWRVVRDKRDPVRGSAPRARWDDGTFDVLYTSQEREGAIAELFFHLDRGQPIFPSLATFRNYEIDIKLKRALRLADMKRLEALGVETKNFGALTYNRLGEEYSRTQEIAETAHFLEFDGLIVPSARWACMNVVLFTDRVAPDATHIIQDHGPIEWDKWKRK